MFTVCLTVAPSPDRTAFQTQRKPDNPTAENEGKYTGTKQETRLAGNRINGVERRPPPERGKQNGKMLLLLRRRESDSTTSFSRGADGKERPGRGHPWSGQPHVLGGVGGDGRGPASLGRNAVRPADTAESLRTPGALPARGVAFLGPGTRGSRQAVCDKPTSDVGKGTVVWGGGPHGPGQTFGARAVGGLVPRPGRRVYRRQRRSPFSSRGTD